MTVSRAVCASASIRESRAPFDPAREDVHRNSARAFPRTPSPEMRWRPWARKDPRRRRSSSFRQSSFRAPADAGAVFLLGACAPPCPACARTFLSPTFRVSVPPTATNEGLRAVEGSHLAMIAPSVPLVIHPGYLRAVLAAHDPLIDEADRAGLLRVSRGGAPLIRTPARSTASVGAV